MPSLEAIRICHCLLAEGGAGGLSVDVGPASGSGGVDEFERELDGLFEAGGILDGLTDGASAHFDVDGLGLGSGHFELVSPGGHGGDVLSIDGIDELFDVQAHLQGAFFGDHSLRDGGDVLLPDDVNEPEDKVRIELGA